MFEKNCSIYRVVFSCTQEDPEVCHIVSCFSFLSCMVSKIFHLYLFVEKKVDFKVCMSSYIALL